MRHIWAPWRMEYIMNHVHNSDCIFCDALNHLDGPENLIIHRNNLAFVILNRFPYTSGHLMVVPFVHKPSFEILDQITRSDIMELMSKSVETLQLVYSPDGFNVGANIGSAAGAGVAGHVHFHVVPRWAGDTNFMSSVGGARVLPESLEQTYYRLQQAWNSL